MARSKLFLRHRYCQRWLEKEWLSCPDGDYRLSTTSMFRTLILLVFPGSSFLVWCGDKEDNNFEEDFFASELSDGESDKETSVWDSQIIVQRHRSRNPLSASTSSPRHSYRVPSTSSPTTIRASTRHHTPPSPSSSTLRVPTTTTFHLPSASSSSSTSASLRVPSLLSAPPSPLEQEREEDLLGERKKKDGVFSKMRKTYEIPYVKMVVHSIVYCFFLLIMFLSCLSPGSFGTFMVVDLIVLAWILGKSLEEMYQYLEDKDLYLHDFWNGVCPLLFCFNVVYLVL